MNPYFINNEKRLFFPRALFYTHTSPCIQGSSQQYQVELLCIEFFFTGFSLSNLSNKSIFFIEQFSDINANNSSVWRMSVRVLIHDSEYALKRPILYTLILDIRNIEALLQRFSSGISLVVGFWMFSISTLSRLNLGCQITFPCSKCGRTKMVNCRGMVTVSRHVTVALIKPKKRDTVSYFLLPWRHGILVPMRNYHKTHVNRSSGHSNNFHQYVYQHHIYIYVCKD